MFNILKVIGSWDKKKAIKRGNWTARDPGHPGGGLAFPPPIIMISNPNPWKIWTRWNLGQRGFDQFFSNFAVGLVQGATLPVSWARD